MSRITSATGRLRYGRPSMTVDAQKSHRHGQPREVCTVKRLYGRSPSRSNRGTGRRPTSTAAWSPASKTRGPSPRAAASTTAGQTSSPSPVMT